MASDMEEPQRITKIPVVRILEGNKIEIKLLFAAGGTGLDHHEGGSEPLLNIMIFSVPKSGRELGESSFVFT